MFRLSLRCNLRLVLKLSIVLLCLLGMGHSLNKTFGLKLELP